MGLQIWTQLAGHRFFSFFPTLGFYLENGPGTASEAAEMFLFSSSLFFLCSMEYVI